MMRRIWVSLVAGLVLLTSALGSLDILPGAVAQDAPPCGETIQLLDNGDFNQGLAGWTGEQLALGGDGGNPVATGSWAGPFIARHDLDSTAGLDGATLTASFRVTNTSVIGSASSVIIDSSSLTLLGSSNIVALSTKWQSVTYQVTLPTPAPAGVYIEVISTRGSALIDDVSVTYDLACPTPTATETLTPTTEPTATSTPVPTATSTPTEVPTGDVDITVTGDPRFPVAGSVALETPGLSYSLFNEPDQGSVVLNPDGSFTYTAESYLVTFDQFTVLASDGTTITVNVVLEIDPNVPTYGEVKPGGTGNGGDAGDARSSSGPVPTTPTDDDDGDNGSCWRCD